MITESWFNASTVSEEITASTNYTCIRGDRSIFQIRQTEGGGVCMLIRRDINHRQLKTYTDKRFENISIEIETGETKRIFVLVCISPNTLRNAKASDFCELLNQISTEHPGTPITVFGDLNMSNISWSFDDDGNCVPQHTTIAGHERQIINFIANANFHQFITTPNLMGKFLDVAFTNEPGNWDARLAERHETIDRVTNFHSGYVITLTYIDRPIEEKQNHRINRIDYAKLKETLQNEPPQNLSQNLLERLMFTRTSLDHWMSRFTTNLKEIQDAHTTVFNIKSPVNQSTHPWTSENSYKLLVTRKNRARKLFKLSATNENKNNLRQANVELMEEYNRLKEQYYVRIAKGLRCI